MVLACGTGVMGRRGPSLFNSTLSALRLSLSGARANFWRLVARVARVWSTAGESPASAVRSLAGIRLVPGRLLVQRVSAFPTARGTLSGWIVGTRYGHTAVVIVLSLCVTLCFINPSINQSMSLCDDPIVPLTCKQAGALVATPVA